MLEEALTHGVLEEALPRPTWGLRRLPETATFRITPYRPQALRGTEKCAEAKRAMRQILEGALEEVRASEAALSAERANHVRKVLGLPRLARQSHLGRPNGDPEDQKRSLQGRAASSNTASAAAPALAPSRFDRFRRIAPVLVARCAETMKTAASVLKTLRSAYRQARDALKRELKDARIPPGTWWIKEHALAPCEPIADRADPIALCLSLN